MDDVYYIACPDQGPDGHQLGFGGNTVCEPVGLPEPIRKTTTLQKSWSLILRPILKGFSGARNHPSLSY